jgi:hypothetical protein
MHVVVINSSAIIQKDKFFIRNHIFCVTLPPGTVCHLHVL